MIFIRNIINNYYYKIRIVLTFSLVTILLVLVMATISYYFIKELYLSQLTEQVSVSIKTVASQIDPGYIDLLDLGAPTKSASDYFNDIFSKHLAISRNAELFIFDKDFNLILHSNPNKLTGQTEANLFLNRHEILNLPEGKAISSLPFRGDDGNWYLWGFYRLNGNYWLASRESAVRLAKVEKFSLTFWYIGITGVIITLLLSLLIMRSITKPLSKLISFSKEIGRGNMSASEPKEIKGEIQALSNAMTMMRNDLIKNQKEKEDMLAQIAHEIRNPLGGIELLASLTREDLIKDNKSTDYLDRILAELNGLKSLITAYLNYSRPMQAQPGQVELTGLIQNVTRLLDSKIKAKEACLEYRINSDRIRFDQGHLKQILINLLSNSLEAIGPKGNIIIETSEANGKVRISVIDDGPGISESGRKKVFEPFFTTRKDGIGLGLAISRKLCIENKAEICLETSEKGSCFTIIKEIENERK